MQVPNGWTVDDWQDYQDYFNSLTCQEQEIELQSMKAFGEAKVSGKNVVVIDQYYEM